MSRSAWPSRRFTDALPSNPPSRSASSTAPTTHQSWKTGCVVATFNPPHWYSLEELNYRSHRKILVVDGQIGFTGGAGIADHWLGNAQDKDHWRDTQIRIEGPPVRYLEACFYENWIESADVVKPELPEERTTLCSPAFVRCLRVTK